MNKIKETIKEARLEKGWSRPAMSRALGIPVRTIENWEYGTTTPPEWLENLVVNAIKNYSKN